MMDEWHKNKQPIATLNLKIYEWVGTKRLVNEEKLKTGRAITEKMLSTVQEARRLESKMAEEKERVETKKQEAVKTVLPYYDINFEVLCNSSSFNFDLVQQYIVVFENVFGLSLPHCSILDFKNHSYHKVSEIFSYAISPSVPKKSRSRLTLEKYFRKIPFKLGQRSRENSGNLLTATEEEKSDFVLKKMTSEDLELEHEYHYDFGKLLSEPSDIFEAKFVQAMQKHIPSYLRKAEWKCVYSTAKHGINISTYPFFGSLISVIFLLLKQALQEL
jgi:hypothetical protein